MKRTLLVDADIVAFKYSSANEDVFYFDGRDSAPSVASDFENAKKKAEEDLEELKRKLKADEIIVCLSDPSGRYFRHDVFPNYKSARKTTRKPEHLMQLKEWFPTKYKTYQRPGLEADDCQGILSTHPTLVKGEKIIVSEDKDMQTIPGLLYNPRKDNDRKGQPKVRRISKLDADRFFLWQAVVGDSCDGYPGAYRKGPKSAEAQAVLESQTEKEAWGHVLAAFIAAASRNGKLSAEDVAAAEQAALVQARCARILRASDWDFTEKKPRLWTPPA